MSAAPRVGESGPTVAVKVAVLVPAAGIGTRMGGVSKPLVELGGRSVLEWAVTPFLAREDVVEVVVAIETDDLGGRLRGDDRVHATRGGRSRFESVANAFDGVRSDATLVAVHDGARPFPPPGAIDACIRLAGAGIGAVAGIPAVDTVKRVTDGGAVAETPPRHALWYAQTPQVFPRDLFARAVERCRAGGAPPTDDASMVEGLGAQVRMVEASATNLKITRPEDIGIAKYLIQQRFV